jgi:hypothetical protein
LKENIPKLEEHAIDDEIFWTLDSDEGIQYESLLDVKKLGQQLSLKERVAEIKDQHDEDFKKSEKARIKKKFEVNTDGVNLLLTRVKTLNK